jgi:hypothetical protein
MLIGVIFHSTLKHDILSISRSSGNIKHADAMMPLLAHEKQMNQQSYYLVLICHINILLMTRADHMFRLQERIFLEDKGYSVLSGITEFVTSNALNGR